MNVYVYKYSCQFPVFAAKGRSPDAECFVLWIPACTASALTTCIDSILFVLVEHPRSYIAPRNARHRCLLLHVYTRTVGIYVRKTCLLTRIRNQVHIHIAQFYGAWTSDHEGEMDRLPHSALCSAPSVFRPTVLSARSVLQGGA